MSIHSSKIALVVLSVASILSTNVIATQGITKKNWGSHPEIRVIRNIYKRIVNGISKERITKHNICVAYNTGYPADFDDEPKVFRDKKGLIRKIIISGGSGDSSLTTEHFYDQKGRLRFVFIHGGAVNGSELEHRIYFGDSNKRIWEDHKYIKGPGYTFPQVWPKKNLIFQPKITKRPKPGASCP